jgi:phosphatidylserine/phosphatidylglycerophosphate/cardiolipin synthase-like enzyme
MRFLFILTILYSHACLANSFNIGEIILSDELYNKYHDSIFSNSEVNDTERFRKRVLSLVGKKKEQSHEMINSLSNIVSSQFLRPLVYWKVIEPNDENFKNTLNFIMVYKAMTLRDGLQSPHSTKDYKVFLLKRIHEIYHRKDIDQVRFLSVLNSDFKEKSNFINNLKSLSSMIEAIKETDAITFKVSHPQYRPYTVSPAGYIPGNEVKLISKNNTSKEIIDWFNETITTTEIKMPLTPRDKGHKSFLRDPIFIKLREMISEAKETILIDTSLLGGSIGETLTDYLIESAKKRIKENPKFTVVILHPSKVEVKFSTEVMSTIHKLDKKVIELNLSKNIFVLKSDRGNIKNATKTIVIDGNTKYPQSYIGSKDYTDNFGGYNYDNNIWVKGPGAALIQTSLHKDLHSILVDHPDKNRILEQLRVKREQFPYAGIQSIRIAETSKNGKVRNIRDFMVEMIMNAKKSIYMEQRYLIDPYVSDTLVKKKLENPKLDIRILLDHNEDLGMNGLPNSIFMQELKLYGINLRARKTHNKKFNTSLSKINAFQVNNRKVISIDGNVLFVGSADINYNDLDGNSRELSIQTFAKQEIKKFDKDFLISWRDTEKTINLDIENFTAKIEDNSFTKEVSSLINSISKAFIKVKNEISESF